MKKALPILIFVLYFTSSSYANVFCAIECVNDVQTERFLLQLLCRTLDPAEQEICLAGVEARIQRQIERCIAGCEELPFTEVEMPDALTRDEVFATSNQAGSSDRQQGGGQEKGHSE